jgi:hypothetical protein
MLTQTYMIHNAEKELRAYITFDAMHRLLDHTTKMKRKAPNERIRQHGLIIMQISSLIQSSLVPAHGFPRQPTIIIDRPCPIQVPTLVPACN